MLAKGHGEMTHDLRPSRDHVIENDECKILLAHRWQYGHRLYSADQVQPILPAAAAGGVVTVTGQVCKRERCAGHSAIYRDNRRKP